MSSKRRRRKRRAQIRQQQRKNRKENREWWLKRPEVPVLSPDKHEVPNKVVSTTPNILTIEAGELRQIGPELTHLIMLEAYRKGKPK